MGIMMQYRYDSVTGVIILLEDKIMPNFQDKIDMVRNGYEVNEAIMKARNSFELDDFRHTQYPDDVLLIFYQEGLKPEGIWCRIESEKDGRPVAVVLNEPYADFGVHAGDMVTFEWGKQDNKMIGIAVLPWMNNAH